jgi:hypothetical protein
VETNSLRSVNDKALEINALDAMADTAPEGWRGPFVGEDAYGNPDHEYQ